MNGKWLGIDTTSATGGVALLDSGVVMAETVLPVNAFHSEKLLPAVAGLLEAAGQRGEELAGIAVSAGPGSYTGVRIGIATAAGLSSGWDVPVKAVSSLRVLSSQLPEGFPVLASIRARKNEVFAALFSSPDVGSKELVPQGVYTVDGLLEMVAVDCLAVGSGRIEIMGRGRTDLNWVNTLLDGPRPAFTAFTASRLVELEGFDDSLEPLYLRDFNQRLD